MSAELNLERIEIEALSRRARELKDRGGRLVQIGATRLADGVELTYSFGLDRDLTNLRLTVTNPETPVPSISSVFWCAFLYENEIHDLFGLRIDGMSVDFHGKLYQTAIQFPFGATKAPAAKPDTTPKTGAEQVEPSATPRPVPVSAIL